MEGNFDAAVPMPHVLGHQQSSKALREQQDRKRHIDRLHVRFDAKAKRRASEPTLLQSLTCVYPKKERFCAASNIQSSSLIQPHSDLPTVSCKTPQEKTPRTSNVDAAVPMHEVSLQLGKSKTQRKEQYFKKCHLKTQDLSSTARACREGFGAKASMPARARVQFSPITDVRIPNKTKGFTHFAQLLTVKSPSSLRLLVHTLLCPPLLSCAVFCCTILSLPLLSSYSVLLHSPPLHSTPPHSIPFHFTLPPRHSAPLRSALLRSALLFPSLPFPSLLFSSLFFFSALRCPTLLFALLFYSLPLRSVLF